MIGTLGGSDNSTEVTTDFSRAVPLIAKVESASVESLIHPIVLHFRYPMTVRCLPFVITRPGPTCRSCQDEVGNQFDLGYASLHG